MVYWMPLQVCKRPRTSAFPPGRMGRVGQTHYLLLNGYCFLYARVGLKEASQASQNPRLRHHRDGWDANFQLGSTERNYLKLTFRNPRCDLPSRSMELALMVWKSSSMSSSAWRWMTVMGSGFQPRVGQYSA